jgi:TLD
MSDEVPTDKATAAKEAAKMTLTNEFRKRVSSLTPAESWFIQALLNDEVIHLVSETASNDASAVESGDLGTVNAVDWNTKQIAYMTDAAKKLSDENLFSTTASIISHAIPPLTMIEIQQPQQKQQTLSSQPVITKARRPSNLDLWKAYTDGVHPQQLKRRGSRTIIGTASLHGSIAESSVAQNLVPENVRKSAPIQQLHTTQYQQSIDSNESTNIDMVKVNDDSDSEQIMFPVREQEEDGSSWDSQDDADHRTFDAWEVLRDEYATEFGFNFTTHETTDVAHQVEDIPNSFQILGTSAEDTSVQPHVMSPPMMDAIMNFLPESILGQNYWLRYSLVRDGASLDTLKRYVRATECTIIAIETRHGEVFGSFTSHPWHNQYGYYGSTPAFVWKMRHSRQTRCVSLFDQAQLESEIDVYMALDGSNGLIQTCTHTALGLGGDTDPVELSQTDTATRPTGFAFYLNSDLSRGTTSCSTTFHNPSLCGRDGNQSHIFDVAGIEVWSLTPCFTVAEAERLEMTKFFIEASIRNLSVSPRTPYNSDRSISNFSGDDFDPRKFYQRVGHDEDSQARRDRWEYMNTMQQRAGQQSTNSGLDASPRFGYEKSS